MTTQRKMELSNTEQRAVIDALLLINELDLAARLGRCMTAHRSRHHGAGRPFSCQSAACVWCRRAMIHGWWGGICDWAEATSSLAILSIGSSVELTQRYATPPTCNARCPRSGGATQGSVA